MSQNMKSVGLVLINGLGRVYGAGLQFIFAPVFIYGLGEESYAIISFYIVLLGSLQFLDQAVSPVFTRSTSLHAAGALSGTLLRNQLRTFEVLSVGLGCIVGLCVIGFSGDIAANWLNTSHLPEGQVRAAIRMMGLILICQWPSFLYIGGLTGLVKQKQMALMRAIFSTLQFCGGALVIFCLSRTIVGFFSWQVLTTLGLTLTMAIFLWRYMPGRGRVAHFTLASFSGFWKFGCGTFAVAVLSVLLTQTDKILVSRYLPAETFLAYNLCFMISMSITGMISGPVQSIIVPLFIRAEKQGEAALRSAYRRWSQLIGIACYPIVGFIAFFPGVLIHIWLGDSPLAATMDHILPVIVAGSALNALCSLPYALQISAGWTRLLTIKNIVAVVIMVPLLLVLVPKYGAAPAAWCWLALNLGYYLIEVPLMHRRLLPHTMWPWYLQDTLCPAACCALTYGGIASLKPSLSGRAEEIVFSVLSGLACYGILFLVMRERRREFLAWLHQRVFV